MYDTRTAQKQQAHFLMSLEDSPAAVGVADSAGENRDLRMGFFPVCNCEGSVRPGVDVGRYGFYEELGLHRVTGVLQDQDRRLGCESSKDGLQRS